MSIHFTPFTASVGTATAAAAGGFDCEDIPRMHVDLAAAADVDQLLRAATLHLVLAHCTRLGTAESERRIRTAALGEQRDFQWLEELDPANDAVAAAMFARLRRSRGGWRILSPARGSGPFEHLGVGQPGVGHVRMHGVGPVGVGASPRRRRRSFRNSRTSRRRRVRLFIVP